jgi:hypothetical protein
MFFYNKEVAKIHPLILCLWHKLAQFIFLLKIPVRGAEKETVEKMWGLKARQDHDCWTSPTIHDFVIKMIDHIDIPFVPADHPSHFPSFHHNMKQAKAWQKRANGCVSEYQNCITVQCFGDLQSWSHGNPLPEKHKVILLNPLWMI